MINHIGPANASQVKTCARGNEGCQMTGRFVGLDVHKATIAVAIAEHGRKGEVRHYGIIQLLTVEDCVDVVLSDDVVRGMLKLLR